MRGTAPPSRAPRPAPGRPMGMCTSRRRAHSGSLISSASSGVSTGPGQSALQRTPRRAHSTAISRVIASTPPLLAVYAICGVAAPISATNDATLTIEPPPESTMAGMPCLHPSQTPAQVDVHDAVPRGNAGLGGAAVVAGHDPGVVVEHVEAAEGVDREPDHRGDLVLVGHVDVHERGLAARVGDRLDRLARRSGRARRPRRPGRPRPRRAATRRGPCRFPRR